VAASGIIYIRGCIHIPGGVTPFFTIFKKGEKGKMKELNHDIEARDKIIYGKYRPNKYKFGGVQKFSGMTFKTLTALLD